MILASIDWLITAVLLGRLGWVLAQDRRTLAGTGHIVGLVAAAALGHGFGQSIIVIGMANFHMTLNWMIVGFCLGRALGLARRNRILRAAPAA